MPRLARLDAPGVLHHGTIRGIEHRNISKDNRDRDNSLGRLAVLLPETQTACYAWVLMPNHAHFLFRTGTVGLLGLPALMRGLLTGYWIIHPLDKEAKRLGVPRQSSVRDYRRFRPEIDYNHVLGLDWLFTGPKRRGRKASFDSMEKPFGGNLKYPVIFVT